MGSENSQSCELTSRHSRKLSIVSTRLQVEELRFVHSKPCGHVMRVLIASICFFLFFMLLSALRYFHVGLCDTA